MNNYKQILEAINRGIQFALDDFNPEEVQLSKPKQETITKDDSLYKAIQLKEYIVDLGLPSGTLWCKYNLGCDWDMLNKEQLKSNVNQWAGQTWSWGELKSKTEGSWDNYKFAVGGDDSYIIKYNSNDNLGELLLEDDAAYQFDNRFRIPTYKQCKELSDNTYSIIVQNYNPKSNCFMPNGINMLNGFAIISKINGNHIFVPYTRGMDACFWSSTLTKQKPKCQTACFLSMSKDWQSGHCYTANSNRCNNMPIRPILNK